MTNNLKKQYIILKYATINYLRVVLFDSDNNSELKFVSFGPKYPSFMCCMDGYNVCRCDVRHASYF